MSRRSSGGSRGSRSGSLKKKKVVPRPVRLNVYDLPDAPELGWAGVGLYHSVSTPGHCPYTASLALIGPDSRQGTEIDGLEYAFGMHRHPGRTGVWRNYPRKAAAFT